MSIRRGLSFADSEIDLVEDYDNNGGSKYAKQCMKFFKMFKDKVVLVNNHASLYQKSSINVQYEQKKSIKSLIK